MLLTAMLFVALVGAVLTPVASARLPQIGGLFAAALPFALFVFLLFLVAPAGQAPIIERVPWVPSLDIDFAWRLDGFSMLFALLITGIGTGVVFYASAYFDKKPPFQRGLFILYIQLFMVAMLATVLADHLLVLFVFWELTSLLSFLLVGFDSTNPIARRAAMQSLLVTVAGGLSLFAGILLIGITAGTFSITALLDDASTLLASPLLPVIIMLVLLGAFTKSAQAPFHFWLPNAMTAPTPASAYLHSATMVKLGVYLVARLDPLFSSVAWFGPLLVAVGGVTMLLAALQALRSVEFKEVLAFSTVASLGTIIMLIGLESEVAAVATAGFILAHALYKATLFFCAGIVIHATGVTRLQRLGGLGKTLPLTATATILAALSMAGLPPFVGFISKEYVFEATLDSRFVMVAVGTAVLVNTVMVAVATVIVLRPFFVQPKRPVPVHHGETLGLTLPPLVFGVLGISLGFAPWIVAQPLIGPAASMIHASPIEVSFQLWHGLTPMLALSVLVVAMGVVLALFWDPIHESLRRRRILDELLLDKGYDNVMRWTMAAAEWSTARLQNGDMRHYAAITGAAVTGLAVYGLLATSGPLWPTVEHEPIRLYLVIVAGLIVAGCLVAATTSSLVTAIVGVGLAGYGMGLIFLLNGGPDLALTQFSVETLFVVIVVAVLLKLPVAAVSTRTDNERWRDMGVSAGFAAAVALATLWVATGPLDRTLTDYFAETSYTEAFGRNVVNVVLVDFRALDTFGEIAVVAFAALGAWALIGSANGRRRGTPTEPTAADRTSQDR